LVISFQEIISTQQMIYGCDVYGLSFRLIPTLYISINFCRDRAMTGRWTEKCNIGNIFD